MIEINKKEFFEEYYQGDIYGLENLQKQLEEREKEIFLAMEENAKSKRAIQNAIAEKLCNEEIDIIRIKNLLNFTIKVNYLFEETQGTKYASKYFSKIEDLYCNDLLQDLFNMLNIDRKDYDKNLS